MEASARRNLLLRAEFLMEQALQLLDEADENHAGALLDHALATLPGRLRVMGDELSTDSPHSDTKHIAISG